MDKEQFEAIYGRVGGEQRQLLRTFRQTHPTQQTGIGGHAWTYTRGGTGDKAVLLLPGGTRSGEAYQTIMGLERSFQVIAPTYPIIATMAELVEGLLGLLDSLAIERAQVFGTSLGGMAAQCLVRRAPARIASVILAHTAAPDALAGRRWQSTLRLLRWMPAGAMHTASWRRLEPLLASAPEAERPFFELYLRELLQRHLTKAWMLTQYRLLVDFNANYHFAPQDLANWPGRILIVEAADDEQVPPEARAALAMLYPQAEVLTFEEGGHATLDRSVAYVQAVTDFLRPPEW